MKSVIQQATYYNFHFIFLKWLHANLDISVCVYPALDRQTLYRSLQIATASKKQALEQELQNLDRDIEATDRELTKLSFLAPQVFVYILNGTLPILRRSSAGKIQMYLLLGKIFAENNLNRCVHLSNFAIASFEQGDIFL